MKHFTTLLFFFLLPVLGVGVVWEAGEPVVFGLCSSCKIPGTQREQGTSFHLKMSYFLSSFSFFFFFFP